MTCITPSNSTNFLISSFTYTVRGTEYHPIIHAPIFAFSVLTCLSVRPHHLCRGGGGARITHFTALLPILSFTILRTWIHCLTFSCFTVFNATASHPIINATTLEFGFHCIAQLHHSACHVKLLTSFASAQAMIVDILNLKRARRIRLILGIARSIPSGSSPIGPWVPHPWTQQQPSMSTVNIRACATYHLNLRDLGPSFKPPISAFSFYMLACTASPRRVTSRRVTTQLASIRPKYLTSILYYLLLYLCLLSTFCTFTRIAFELSFTLQYGKRTYVHGH